MVLSHGTERNERIERMLLVRKQERICARTNARRFRKKRKKKRGEPCEEPHVSSVIQESSVCSDPVVEAKAFEERQTVQLTTTIENTETDNEKTLDRYTKALETSLMDQFKKEQKKATHIHNRKRAKDFGVAAFEWEKTKPKQRFHYKYREETFENCDIPRSIRSTIVLPQNKPVHPVENAEQFERERAELARKKMERIEIFENHHQELFEKSKRRLHNEKLISDFLQNIERARREFYHHKSRNLNVPNVDEAFPEMPV
ncbi:hypothetical protein PCE1_002296 [Barthelona sp. PCE]